MAKGAEYTCVVEYSEDTSQRLTEALTELYYNIQRGIAENGQDKHEDETA